MFRAALNLFARWGITDEQAAVLTDMPVRSFRRWKAEGPGRISRDGLARLSNLMGIHKALRIIFQDPQRGYDWIRAPNAAFEEASALAVMLDGEQTDIMRCGAIWIRSAVADRARLPRDGQHAGQREPQMASGRDRTAIGACRKQRCPARLSARRALE
jgi:hypothetical protein